MRDFLSKPGLVSASRKWITPPFTSAPQCSWTFQEGITNPQFPNPLKYEIAYKPHRHVYMENIKQQKITKGGREEEIEMWGGGGEEL